MPAPRDERSVVAVDLRQRPEAVVFQLKRQSGWSKASATRMRGIGRSDGVIRQAYRYVWLGVESSERTGAGLGLAEKNSNRAR